jgi:hypothetical protein
MSLNFDFKFTEREKNGAEIHNHNKEAVVCEHPHLDFCLQCKEFYCLDCPETDGNLKEVFLKRFLASDHCQSMEDLRDYLYEQGFVVDLDKKETKITASEAHLKSLEKFNFDGESNFNVEDLMRYLTS